MKKDVRRRTPARPLRHGQSEWNLKNLFTGWRDVDLSPLGVEEAKEAGRRLKARGIVFDVAFTSALSGPSIRFN